MQGRERSYDPRKMGVLKHWHIVGMGNSKPSPDGNLGWEAAEKISSTGTTVDT